MSRSAPADPSGPHTPGRDDAGFWRRIVEASTDPVLVLDDGLVCRFASASLLAVTGLGHDDVVGQPLQGLILDADGSTVVERLDRVGSGDPVAFGVTVRTGAGVPLYARASVRTDELDGTPVHVVVLHVVASDSDAEHALKRRVDLEKLLERVQHRFIHAVPAEIGAVIAWALEEVATFLGADRGYVLSFDHSTRTETMIHEWAAPGVIAELGLYIDVSWDLAPAATQRNNDLWISAVRDVSQLDGEWAADRAFFEESGLRSILELPLIVDGHPVGGLGFDWITSLADWTEDDLTLLGMFASTFAQLIGRDAAERELVRRATHDQLTGLPNRDGFLARLEAALESRRSRNGVAGPAPTGLVAVLVVDLDQFNVINDSLGNAAGDELLRLVGARLSGLVRPTDVVARLGGDEFAVLLTESPDEWTVSQTSERLRADLAKPFHFRDRDHLLTVSSGIALSSSACEPAAELLRRAGAAMFRAKELGRARQSVFDVELELRIAERLDLDQRLRMALDRHEFEVHFQPEVELATGRIIGAEALLRWRTDGELRDAATFIDVVEETGLIVTVGRWVLDQACRAAARWRSTPGHHDFVMRVNLSPRQLEQPDLVDHVRATLSLTGLDARHLCLEITETALMSNAEAALGQLTRLDALGISLAIDDFGTGYSSLSYLKRFPVDILKIDRSFVNGLPGDSDDAAIVRTIIRLADSLGMTVTAEGIETPEQADALVALNCDRGQGYLFSRAVAAASMDDMLTGAAVLSR